MKHLETFGIYNVGWVSFRRDANGRACVEWWRERTNEWCLDQVDGERFADQGYLNQFPRLFAGVHVLSNLGANLAPWNVGARTISNRGGAVYANNDRVLFFHFHRLRRLNDSEYLVPHGTYKAPLDRVVRDQLYRPYLREVQALERDMEARFGPLERSPVRELRSDRNLWGKGIRKAVRMVLNRMHGYVITPN
jgi:hypothetical protein